jgi:hypothetical protein
VGFQRAAVAAVIARLRPFRPCGARTADIDEVEIALSHKIANPSRCFRSALALYLASRSPSFRRIEAHKPDIRLLLIDADRIAIDHANVVGINWLGESWR